VLGNFKWLSQDEGRMDLPKNLHSSPFNEGSTFKQILRAGEAQNSAFNVVSIFHQTERKKIVIKIKLWDMKDSGWKWQQHMNWK
jgi:hypothetical protein